MQQVEMKMDDLNKFAIQEVNKVDPTFFERLSKTLHDIDASFLGFINFYYHLSCIIPKERVIIDLGCAYATQSIFFLEHKHYYGIDLGECEQVHTPNSTYFNEGIDNFIKTQLPEIKKINKDNLFAICNFVPPWYGDNQALTREHFKHCFVYYPVLDDDTEKIFVKKFDAAMTDKSKDIELKSDIKWSYKSINWSKETRETLQEIRQGSVDDIVHKLYLKGLFPDNKRHIAHLQIQQSLWALKSRKVVNKTGTRKNAIWSLQIEQN